MLIQVISSTTREGRFSEKVVSWVTERLGAREDFEIEQIDLRHHPLPFFDGVAPARAPASTRVRRSSGWAARWTGPTGSSRRPPNTTTATRPC